MDSGQLIAIIVGVVVVLAIVAAAIILSRKRKAVVNRNKAAELREQARAEEFTTMEREAKAARAEADARQAEVEAERLRRNALDSQHEAESARAGLQEQLRKADELDPDGATAATAHRGEVRRDTGDTGRGDAGHGDTGPAGTKDGTGHPDRGTEQLLRDRAGRKHVSDGTAGKGGDDQDRGDRPRKL